ncbi:HTH-type transcriptional activator RhaS [Pseudovibrio axinellae]|uniref:HTH-type transcriptional activator RhaS n=1 Tax=Pseudovibrio axinellae TaxID=989403 RepID=A0A165YWJ5_9HYPH|nr:helix-turn-helix domain-containing protein [Pseudovibrio axinellae]KZL19298.1 HTH-type transcriptional activator RhaS [Pseudovibrio axinellae]SEQ42347.1 transcriptional regulator, AraC family [Pseudovibrio axinellae]
MSGPILPDGCRDLIVTEMKGERPSWQVSELFDEPHQIERITVKRMIGFRLKPGTQVNKPALLAALNSLKSWDETRICEQLAEQTSLNNKVFEALSCIQKEQLSIAASAGTLGVTLKTLQRTLARHTNRSPVYWRQLARIRKAARHIESAQNWADFALDNGFSDQAHMTREFQRWFGTSPMQFVANIGFRQQAQSVAFG